MGGCSSCGSEIPEGQGSSCSMCYGDIAYGSDGYYEEWAREQMRQEDEKQEAIRINAVNEGIRIKKRRGKK